MYIYCQGNASILPYYFTTGGPVLKYDASLHVSLRLDDVNQNWVIIISGMSKLYNIF